MLISDTDSLNVGLECLGIEVEAVALARGPKGGVGLRVAASRTHPTMMKSSGTIFARWGDSSDSWRGLYY
jgi:hypothetical protein